MNEKLETIEERKCKINAPIIQICIYAEKLRVIIHVIDF